MMCVIPQPWNNWYEYCLLSYYQPKVWEKKKLVLGGTILKKGKFQSKYVILLT